MNLHNTPKRDKLKPFTIGTGVNYMISKEGKSFSIGRMDAHLPNAALIVYRKVVHISEQVNIHWQ